MIRIKACLQIILTGLILSQSAYGFTILLDPGHGGEDHGARNTIIQSSGGKKKSIEVYEKDLTLKITQRIFKKLKARNYNVFMTRSVDRTVTLEERAATAEKIKANLFISVHINSSPKVQSHGYEIFYLDNHSDVAVKKVEEVENRNPKGEDPLIQHILIDLAIGQTVDDSKKLTGLIHHHMKKLKLAPHRMSDRGVKPGLFYVLALTKRPGALLEAGFISNAKEVLKLLSPAFQEAYAEAVVKGLEDFVKANKLNQATLLKK